MTDKHCNHEFLTKEYFRGMDTGDYTCQDCGRKGYGRGWPEEERAEVEANLARAEYEVQRLKQRADPDE